MNSLLIDAVKGGDEGFQSMGEHLYKHPTL
jgi:hypothetical protein